MTVLVAGGCSFTDCFSGTKWPVYLAEELDAELVNTGLISSGNGLISRRIIYQVSKLLETHEPGDLLVGILWSGVDRHDFYLPSVTFDNNTDNWKENPAALGPDMNRAWVIMNHHWTTDINRTYYGNFHDEIGSLIYTFEHILRVQWFLKLHKIPYFMSTYTRYVFPYLSRTHTDLVHLYNQIDHGQFLPVSGQSEWCHQSGIEFTPPDLYHPNEEHNKKFTQQVIIPFLKSKQYI
jgi:hypothetical protein